MAIATETRILRTSKGMEVETHLTDDEAIHRLREVAKGKVETNEWQRNFAGSLVTQWDRNGLSANQWPWAHKIVIDVENQSASSRPKPSKVNIGSFAGIRDLFDVARQSLKRPKVRLRLDGIEILLRVFGERSHYCGEITVVTRDAQTWFGRIDRDGDFHPSGNSTDAIVDLLKKFAADPGEVAAEYGKLTGNCCFCGRDLTDDRSTEVGYGPVCADKFNLPWG